MTEEQLDAKAKNYATDNVNVLKIAYSYTEIVSLSHKGYVDGYHECENEHEWHDLRKDPTDLPKEEREYIVMNANEGGDTSYWICYYWKEEKKFTGYGLGEANVIKWKEIE